MLKASTQVVKYQYDTHITRNRSDLSGTYLFCSEKRILTGFYVNAASEYIYVFSFEKKMFLKKPQLDEYAAYYQRYVDKIPACDISDYLSKQVDAFTGFLAALPDTKHEYRYAEDKWTIKQVFQHVIDTERIFAYRLLCIARNDKAAFPGFDENTYAEQAKVDGRLLIDMLEEFNVVRKATVYLINSFKEEEMLRIGEASNYAISARALAYIIAGHVEHHTDILKERYL
jgi:hypothetical protein